MPAIRAKIDPEGFREAVQVVREVERLLNPRTGHIYRHWGVSMWIDQLGDLSIGHSRYKVPTRSHVLCRFAFRGSPTPEAKPRKILVALSNAIVPDLARLFELFAPDISIVADAVAIPWFMDISKELTES